jgi:GGDEF domain-containing protein
VGRLGKPNTNALTQLANRILRKVSGQVVEVGDTCIVVRCSIGIATSGPLDLEIDSVIHRADMALYGAKMGGRGQAILFGADLDGDGESTAHSDFSTEIPPLTV